jgi:hypothetical protein
MLPYRKSRTDRLSVNRYDRGAGTPSGHLDGGQGDPEAFLHANYADEIATMLEISPDYLAITRETVEARPQGEAVD